MTASNSPIGAKLSSTDVRMCATRKAIASNDTLRCIESTTNRGQRGVLQRCTSITPRAIAMLSSSIAIAPVERVRYQ